MVKGWIKIYRKLEDNVLWKNNEPFDRRSAWIDLLLMANYEDSECLFDGKPFTVKRGQVLTSVRKLGVKWSWSKDRVLHFLRLLESTGMCTKSSNNKRTLITIVNYEIYQGLIDTDKDTDRYTDKDTDKDADKDTGSPHIKNNKNDKEDQEEEEGKKNKSVSDKSDTSSDKKSDYDVIKDMWNELDGLGNIKGIRSINGQRRSLVGARLKQYSLSDFREAIDRIKISDYLQGKSKNGWTITFDWFILPSNFPKVLEGNYDNKNVQMQHQPQQSSMDDWVARREREQNDNK